MSGNAKQRRKARRAAARFTDTSPDSALRATPATYGEVCAATREVGLQAPHRAVVRLDEWREAREVDSGVRLWSWPVLGSTAVLLVAIAAFVAWLYTLPFGAR